MIRDAFPSSRTAAPSTTAYSACSARSQSVFPALVIRLMALINPITPTQASTARIRRQLRPPLPDRSKNAAQSPAAPPSSTSTRPVICIWTGRRSITAPPSRSAPAGIHIRPFTLPAPRTASPTGRTAPPASDPPLSFPPSDGSVPCSPWPPPGSSPHTPPAELPASRSPVPALRSAFPDCGCFSFSPPRG